MMSLQTGKLPPRLLRSLIRYTGAFDPTVLIGPRFGEDAAVIQLGRDCLVLKSDPVTFTALEVGWYAVHVNANDVAVMGARPRWFQTTLIVPPGTSARIIRGIFRDVHEAAQGLGVAVTGGHTEISTAVNQPVIAGDMQGMIRRTQLVTSAGARVGDLVLLTKSAGLEGTSILARERPLDAARVLGPTGQRCAARFHRHPGISVVKEALLAARHGARAMHDPTEGGVAAGLYELATASSCRLRIDLDRIQIHPLTAKLCQHFGIDPLGLIASGSLLAAVAPHRAPSLVRRLAAAGVPATIIGDIGAGRGLRADRGGKPVRLRWSERDELARVL